MKFPLADISKQRYRQVVKRFYRSRKSSRQTAAVHVKPRILWVFPQFIRLHVISGVPSWISKMRLSMWANHTWTAFIKTPERALNLLFYLLLIILICYDESSCAWYRANLPLFMAKLYQIFSPFLCPFPGQITQWNLMFHGTNDPPQKSDPPRVGKKKTVNDLVHNSLENSQWGFITQDVSVVAFCSCLHAFRSWSIGRLTQIAIAG